MSRLRRLRQLASGVLVVGVVAGVVGAPASASTVQLVGVPYLEPFCGKYDPNAVCRPTPIPMLVYEAGRGEANRVRIVVRDGSVRIRDSRAVIEPGTGCSPAGRHRVSCAMPDENAGLYVATGGQGDRVKVGLEPGPRLIVDGGAGNDVLVGGGGNDQLFGGRGRDVLRGRGGGDTLFDGAPRRMFRAGDPSPFEERFLQDTAPLVSPGAGRDSFDGGGGHDTVDYAVRSEKLTVDLATRARIGGQRGERDSVRRVESATGGSGDDRLRGNSGVNELRAGPGNDRIAGRGGNDYLEGGTGLNVFSGGAGNDRAVGSEREPERIACGPGTDEAFSVDAIDFVNDDCEQLGFFDGLSSGIVNSGLPLREGQAPTVVVATVGCTLYSRCQGRLEVSVEGPAVRGGSAPPRGTLLGCRLWGPTNWPDPREERQLSLALSPAGLATVRRYRALFARVSFTREDIDNGAVLRDSYSTVLRTPFTGQPGSSATTQAGAAQSATCG